MPNDEASKVAAPFHDGPTVVARDQENRLDDDSSVPPESVSFSSSGRWRIGHRGIAIVAGLLLVFGLLATTARIITKYQTPGPFTPQNQGLCDFHNGIYYPARAVLSGESPYSEAYAAKFPVARQIPFFSPTILLLHAPIAVLPLRPAEIVNTIMQIALMILIAIVCARAAGFPHRIDAVLAIAAGIILTRGGHITLFNGYFTFQLVLATFLSITWADRRPIAAGWMLMIVSAKPTYILPLGFLLLARGNYRALCVGATLSVVSAAALLSYIAVHQNDNFASGVNELLMQIVQTQEVHRSMEDESPVHSWTRLDLFAIIAKWSGNDPGDLAHLLAMFAILALPMLVLRTRQRQGVDDGIAGLTGGLVLLGTLVSLYHQSYDSLLIAAPIAGAMTCRLESWRRVPTTARWVIVGLMILPAVNYLSTHTFLERFEPSAATTKVFTSLNGISLTTALLLACFFAWREVKR